MAPTPSASLTLQAQPAPESRGPGLPALLGVGLGVAVLRQAWVMAQALQVGLASARAMQAFETRPAQPQARVLLLGDSTGVGVGAGDPQRTLAGLLAAEFPHVEIVNRSRNGARVGDGCRLLPDLHAEGRRYDLALLLLGGNDVLRLTPLPRLAAEASALLVGIQALATRSIWVGCADLGGSPVLPPPLSWGMRWRTGRTVQLLRDQAHAHGVPYLDFFAPPAGNLPAQRAGTCFADDGLHPNAEGYQHCFDALKHHGVLPAALAARHPHPPESCHAQRV